MAIKSLLQQGKKFEIEAYQTPKDVSGLRETHVPFSGSPHRHPYDPKKVVLMPDPYSSAPFYYEFKNDDISFLEELPSIASEEGRTIRMVRIWVKKRSVATLCSPFIVEETRR
jgi:hypothetical protein